MFKAKRAIKVAVVTKIEGIATTRKSSLCSALRTDGVLEVEAASSVPILTGVCINPVLSHRRTSPLVTVCAQGVFR
jgi:hypothetical protein